MGKHITPVVLAVIKKGDTYLLTKRVEPDDVDTQHEFHGLWQLPGGGLEFGESVENGVIREAREELGVRIEIEYMIPKLHHRVYQNKWHGLLVSFLCRITSSESEIKLNHEASEWGWFTIDQIREMKTFPLIVPIIEKVASNAQ